MKVGAVLIFLLLLQFAQAQQYNFSGVDKTLSESSKDLGKNVAALIYKDGKVIYQKEMGEMTTTTIEPIASCSKWLTAALVMTFVDEGKISLDDKVSKYLPVFEKNGKGYITIRHCLAHLTGIHSEKNVLLENLKLRRYSSLEDEINDFASKSEIDNNPGVEFRYSTVGLNIAARVLEVISKRSFEQLMQQRIFRPLNMKNSTFNTDDNRAVNPSGGAVSTAKEYMNFLVMILNKGTFNGKRILSENAIAEMQRAQTKLDIIKYAPKVATGYNYGLGEWILDTTANGTATVVSSPGLFGTWPVVDNCRGYACIFFVKSLLSEQKKEVYVALKNEIDKVLPAPIPQ